MATPACKMSLEASSFSFDECLVDDGLRDTWIHSAAKLRTAFNEGDLVAGAPDIITSKQILANYLVLPCEETLH